MSKKRGVYKYNIKEDFSKIKVPVCGGGILIEASKSIGNRLDINGNFLLLDGNPSSVDEIMIETNRLKRLRNEEQIGGNSKWREIK